MAWAMAARLGGGPGVEESDHERAHRLSGCARDDTTNKPYWPARYSTGRRSWKTTYSRDWDSPKTSRTSQNRVQSE
jgi:hypothetical protein